MNILSIDVGIKNLALCLVNYIDKTQYTILKWNVLNLCKDELKKCDCGVNASFTYNNKYYCKRHTKLVNKSIIPNELLYSKIKKIKIKELKELLKLNNIIFDESLSKPLLLEFLETYLPENFVIPFNNSIKTNDFSLVQLGINLNELLNIEYNDIHIDKVIIENQISPIATRMTTLQGMISQYFIMRNVHDIEFISASNKLKEFYSNKNSTYTERKKKGIEVCNELLINNSNLNKELDMFISHKKKDDLADCLLQVIWYLKANNNLIYN